VLPLKLAAAALIVMALGFAGDGDFEDARASELDYIQRVCAGVHADYNRLGVACGD
jgi:hypothetical protein